MYYPLSQILNFSGNNSERFKGHRLDILEDDGFASPGNVISVKTNKKKNNFGPVISRLPIIFPHIYHFLDGKIQVKFILTNDNQRDLFAWYFDGAECFTIKKNLPEVSSFSIREEGDTSGLQAFGPAEGLWISKPSHPYIGSGLLIKIGSKIDLENRGKETYGFHEVDTWVLQPLRSDLLFWHDQKKFDLRFHVVLYSFDKKIQALIFKFGLGRKCVNLYDPINDPSSAITNVSFQKNVYGYDPEINILLIEDNVGMVRKIMQDLANKTKGKLILDPRKKHQILLLGLDIMISSNGEPILIEINTDPFLDLEAGSNLEIMTLGTVLGLFGYLIPSLAKGEDVMEKNIPDWEKISFHC